RFQRADSEVEQLLGLAARRRRLLQPPRCLVRLVGAPCGCCKLRIQTGCNRVEIAFVRLQTEGAEGGGCGHLRARRNSASSRSNGPSTSTESSGRMTNARQSPP